MAAIDDCKTARGYKRSYHFIKRIQQAEREREREAIERAEGDIECEEMRATERMKETSS